VLGTHEPTATIAVEDLDAILYNAGRSRPLVYKSDGGQA
jgi:hypothetical protein